MNVRMYSDNVMVELEPLEKVSAGGIHLPDQTYRTARGSVYGKVLASGPGYHRQVKDGANGSRDGAFVPNETRPGDRVLLPATAGDTYAGELSVPRHNVNQSFGQVRIVRESEILAILPADAG